MYLAVFGDEADGVWFELVGDVDDFWDGGHFEVESEGEHFFEVGDVVVLDVTAVLSEVNGDLVCAGVFADFCGFGDAWDGTFSCFAKCCYVVDVYA